MLAPQFPPALFTDAKEAFDRVKQIYDANIHYVKDSFHRFAGGDSLEGRVRGRYPEVRLQVTTAVIADSQLAFGFVSGPGTYAITLTRPDLFQDYYVEQFQLLLDNHEVPLEIVTGSQPIALHFAFSEGDHVEGQMSADRRALMRDFFDLPDLSTMDDAIANGNHFSRRGDASPLALFTAPRVDYSLHRLRHYSGTLPEFFQNYVLFTNYQFYVDQFVELGRGLMQQAVDPANPSDDDDYIGFIEPGNAITWRVGTVAEDQRLQGQALIRLPQMPAYHLIRRDRAGISMVNIGVGPSNAKTMTDHIAVLRPHAWMMLGHCAGLRNTQQLGDYVLAHAYLRDDHVLDADLPLWIPIPPLAEVQLALEAAVAQITQLKGLDLKRIMRTGTVATVDNRNWELLPRQGATQRFSQSRAIAVDMESATIAANGFRFRVPYGTLLCVSDKPLHGEIKLPGMANHFYRERIDQHLRIGMKAIEILRTASLDRLHSRKLRGFDEVAFQ